jgi:CRISPR/Cas system-associated protein Csm6
MDSETNTCGAVATAETSKTIEQFCEVENISISTYYKLKRLGLSPAELAILPKVIRITPQAHALWREQTMARATSEAAQLETERRRQLAKMAGERSAKSPAHNTQRRG